MAQPSAVTYAVITTAEAQGDCTYTDTPEASDGTAFFMPPLRVVKSVSAEDGTVTGTMFTIDYQYQSMRAGADGRGPSGFASVRAIDRRPVAGVMASRPTRHRDDVCPALPVHGHDDARAAVHRLRLLDPELRTGRTSL